MEGEWPDVPKRERGRPLRRRPKPQIALTRHEVKEFGGWMWCVRCGRRAATQRMRRKLWEADCQPPPWTTAGAHKSGMVGSLEASVAVVMAASAAAEA
eukprot:6957943-Pyramimonas_sp.AAC.1